MRLSKAILLKLSFRKARKLSSDINPFVIGRVVQGYGIASGSAKESPYPKSTIEMQVPFFKALGLDISSFYMGTINVDIAPFKWKPIAPYKRFDNVKWFEERIPENFMFFRCKISIVTNVSNQSANSLELDSYNYYPDPSTKIAHFHNSSTMEILAPYIENLNVGCEIKVEFFDSEISVTSVALQHN